MVVSAVILNFNRPGYIKDKIIPGLDQIDEIDEIVISNGKKETDLTAQIKNSKVKSLQHAGEMNKKYGLTLRFLSALEAKNEYIMIMDDDILPSQKTVSHLLEKVKEKPDIIHGIYGRDIRKNYSYENVFGNVPIVLTRCLMTTKEKCKFFIDHFRNYENELVKNSKPYWNGEDILFSLMSVQQTGKMNCAYQLSHDNRVWNYLNLSESISVGGNHDQYRKKISQEFSKNLGITDLVKEKTKVTKKKYQLTYFVENSSLIYIPLFLMAFGLFLALLILLKKKKLI